MLITQHEYPNIHSFFEFILCPMYSTDLTKICLIVVDFWPGNTNFYLKQTL